jgi:hypothetical protein
VDALFKDRKHYDLFLLGIDYTHPALGGGFGPGFKVIGGFDLVGDNYTGVSTCSYSLC